DSKASILNLEDEVFLGRIRRGWSDKKILVADDVEANFLFLKAVLKETKAKILWAKNGEEAIALIHNQPDISLVLMDIRMPETDGYQAAKAIKEIAPSIPVIAQTAFTETEDQQKAIEAGCDDYIAKPISVVELLSIMSSLF
ncbi:MAG: response regulator, partial [Bacteroidales bacterium]|nr:response regulator [Bacteroidales bacterium]